MGWRAAPDDEVLCHEEAGEAFLLHVPSGEYFGLNQSGLTVWKALRDGLDPEEQLAARWPEVPRDSLHEDAVRILEALTDAGLIVESGDAPGGP